MPKKQTARIKSVDVHWAYRTSHPGDIERGTNVHTTGTGENGKREAEFQANRIARNAVTDTGNGAGQGYSRDSVPVEVISCEVTTYEPEQAPWVVDSTVTMEGKKREVEDESRRRRQPVYRGSEAGCYS